ncbi:MAG: GTPase, partial [Pseudomonadota bacterium]
EGLREDFAKRLTEIYVREVGHAAIDLYSGRLRVSDDVLDDYVSPDTLAERGKSEDRIAEPLRFLIAGQQGAGKTSLINAMADDVQSSVDVLPSTRDYQGFEVQREGLPPVVLVDSLGLATLDEVDALVERAVTSDLIVWVVPAHRADRDIDRQALEALKTAFAEMVDRRPPAVLLVATHIDRLRPFHVWAPPYDVEDGQDAKSQSIHTALLAVRDDLPISESAIVPVSLSPDHPAYNVDLVWAQIAGLLPEVKSAQLLRRLAGAVHSGGWGKVLSQGVGAGRLMVRTISNRGRRS